MAKQLNVNLSFSADTAKAKQQIQELNNALTKITQAPLTIESGNMTQTIQEASIAAQQLKNHIQAAVNVDTGALDFSKLNASFQKSGTTITDYASKIAALGPTGQQALSQLASAINQAEIPIKRSNKALMDMMTTLKNTARWQLSSSVLHGFMGAVQSAYGYAQDLNASLNEIRIVTGQNTEQMAKFAEKANNAARSLSTTTTEYTNASLIYYQQGLSDDEVAARTAITVKMANAAGQSAETVSDQLTAVWNNFYDGSKSLEYYADAMTALGAATASSTDEISEGLNKFASVAETVGLSYEYAAAALATVTATTRQSADVVGTAFKTLFARLQDLELGNTLDDGTTLGKYSAALAAVGVHIKDTNGEMKDMDQILNELGNKWNNLSKDTQVALAQTVAGTRQYTQLVALMDNWDYFQENLGVVQDSSGTLDEQAKIYAESWEAAQDRVQTALEKIYKNLIDEDFFIGLLDNVAGIIDFVDELINSLGGLSGVLSTVSVILMRTFSDQLSQKIRDMAYNLKMSTEWGRKQESVKKDQQASEIGTILRAGASGEGSLVGEEIANQYDQQRQMQQALAENQSRMNEEEINAVKHILDLRRQIGEEIIKQRQKQEEGRQQSSQGYEGALAELGQYALDAGDFEIDDDILAEFEIYRKQVKESEIALTNLTDNTTRYQQAQRELTRVLNDSNSTEKQKSDAVKEVDDAYAALESTIMDTAKVNNGASISTEQAKQAFDKLIVNLDGTDDKAEEAAQAVAGLSGTLQELSRQGQQGMTQGLSISQENVDNMVDGWQQTAHSANQAEAGIRAAAQAQDLYSQRLKESKALVADWASNLVSFGQGLMSFVSIINSAKGAIDTLTNPDASGWEKFSAVLMSFASVVMMTTSMIEAFKKANFSLRKEVLVGIVTKAANVVATGAEMLATALATATEKAKEKQTEKTSAAIRQQTKDNYANATSELADAAATEVNNKAKKNAGKGMKNLGKSSGELGKSFKNLGGQLKNLGSSAKGWISANAGMLGGVALIAAGVAVAVGAVAWGINQYKKYEKAAAEAALQAEKAAAAYQSVAEAYAKFTGSLDAYKNARDGMEGLTEGTTEFKAAVLEANEAAMELLNTYEGLQYTVDDNGLITINEESLNMVQEQEMQKVENAQQANMIAQQNAREKALEAEKKQFQRDNLKSSEGGWAGVGNALAAGAAGAGAGALIGAGTGLVAGGGVFSWATTAIGAAIGAIVGGVTGTIGAITAGAAVDEEEEALNKLAEVYAKEGNARFADEESFRAMLAEQGITDKALVESLVANRQSTMELVAEMAENTAATRQMNEQMVASQMGDKVKEQFKGENAEALGQEAIEAMGAGLEDESARLYEEKWKDQSGGLTDAEIQKKYAEAMGWDVEKTENKNGNKATYYDKEGNVVAEDLSDEVARKFLAQQEALQNAEANMAHYVKAVQDLADAGDALGKGAGTVLASFAGGDGNLSGLTKNQMDNLSTDDLQIGTTNEDGTVSSFTFNGEVFDDEKAKLLGYDSANAFYEAFSNEITRVEGAWDSIELDFEKAGLDPKVVGDLSLEAAQKFQKSLEQMNYGALGTEGAKKYADGIDLITQSVINAEGEMGMGEADVASFIEQLGSVDWSNWYAMEDVEAMLQEMGYDLDMTNPKIQAFVEQMRTIGSASPADAIKRTEENIEALGAKLQEGIAPGSLLDEEIYTKLIEQNSELQNSFMKTLDGQYKYVGDEVLGVEQLGLADDLATRRETSALYGAAKKDASNLDLAGLASLDYTSSEDVKTAQDAEAAAKTAQAAAKAEDDKNYWYSKKKHDAAQANLAQANTNLSNATQHTQNVKDQRDKDFQKAQEITQGILDSDSLMDVAAYHGWSEERIQEIKEGLARGEDASMEAAKELSGLMNKFMVEGNEGTYDVAEAEERIASMATSIEELDQLTQQYGLSAETYNKAWAGLNQTEKWEDMDTEQVADYAEHLQNVAEQSDIVSDELKNNAKAAETVALYTTKLNKGIDKLSGGIDEWSSVLEDSDEASQEYAEAMADMKDAMSDVLGVSDKFLTDDFITENLEDIKKAAEGDAEAIDRLAVAAARSIIVNMEFNDTGVKEQVLSLHDALAAELPDLEVGATLNDGDFLAKANEIVSAAGMTVDEANAYFSALGFEPEFVTKEEEVEQRNPITVTETADAGTRTEPLEDGTQLTWVKTRTSTYNDGYTVNKGKVDVIAMSSDGKTPQIKSLTRKTSGAMNNKSSSNKGGSSGGGGGGSKKKADKKKKSDIVERYKEVTDALDDNADAMDKASRAADRLYGRDRLAKMREANKLLQKEIDLTKQKRKEAEQYLKEDKEALKAAADEAGVNLTFDDKGNISNYTEEMSKLYKQLDDEITKANKDGNADEDEQENIDAIQTKIDALKDAMSTYEDTRELIEDLDSELEEKFNEWQDANFDILNTELELKIEINDMDLQRIEYYLGKIEDDFYQMAEAAALMVFDSNGSWGGQLTSYTDQLASQAQYLADLETKYRNNEISQASYIEGLKNASSAIYEQLGSLQELDAIMMEYYSETLAAAGEEIAKYTDLMESASGVLEHYTSLAELMGKSTDYQYMGKILSSQAEVAADAYKVSKANYEMLKGQEADREKAYKDAVARDASEEELELLEKQWWDARTATAEAQDQMLSDAEAWGEALGAILDNALSKAAQALENTLADGFGSFDAMNSAFERKNALQEEYLTTTNKIYETNKMMRTAQQEIDKTTNEAAKRKLKQFINETDALQDQTQLSQYELEIQQAKYDLLLAEIALEEAQNAKSTVRLQRDNEGNFSYVYTADQDKVADAQQKFEDAQNNLYNIGLEGANDYAQKYQETMQEMYDTITEIEQNHRDNAYESELEYQQALEEAKEYYYQKLTQYSNLYQVALTTDTRVAADAWTTEFASMTERTGDWMTAVDSYVDEVAKAFGEWKSGMDLIHTDTLANIDQDLSNIESDSEELATTVTETLIPALEAEMDAVADVTEKYATFRETLQGITEEYEAMAEKAEYAIKTANGLEDGTDTGNPGDGSNNDQGSSGTDSQSASDSNDTTSSSSGLTWERVKQAYEKIMAGSWGNGVSHRVDEGKKDGYTEAEVRKAQELVNLIYGGKSMSQAKSALGFDTGGYTGDWSGSYGKLAFLHKKELILKQGDTENFLASMEILERILQMIDLQATSAQLGGILSTPTFSHYNEGVLEQNVHIEASFPGVTDHNEVELAMTNLINTASQYANRK